VKSIYLAAGEGLSVIPLLAAAEHPSIQRRIAYRELGEPRAGRTIALGASSAPANPGRRWLSVA
jgi:DNA-binding transcriptional LysR family regulator